MPQETGRRAHASVNICKWNNSEQACHKSNATIPRNIHERAYAPVEQESRLEYAKTKNEKITLFRTMMAKI